MTTLSRPSVFMLEFSGQLTTPDRFSYHTGKGDIAAIDSAQDQTLHQMMSRVLRERPRNRPQLSEDCEAGPHKSHDMRCHCQVPVEDKTEITDLVLRLNSIRTNDKRVAV